MDREKELRRKIKEIQDGTEDLRAELHEIEKEKTIKKNSAFLGKCFKFRNSYGRDKGWWLYAQIVGLTGDGNLIEWQFEIDYAGGLKLSSGRTWYGGLDKNYIPISEMEFKKAWSLFKAKLPIGTS